jgi:DNA-binding NtrC family response regulator
LALELTEGKKKKVADLLGIDRKTPYRKLEEYGKAE